MIVNGNSDDTRYGIIQSTKKIGSITITGLNSLQVTTGPNFETNNRYDGVVEAHTGGSISINNVTNIILGTENSPINNVGEFGGPALHAISGDISIQNDKEGTTNVNIQANANGILAQQIGGKSEYTGSVSIGTEEKRVNDVTVNAGSTAVQANLYGNKKDDENNGSATVKIYANTVSIVSSGTANGKYAVYSGDKEWGNPDSTNYMKGTTAITISGKNGVEINGNDSQKGMGIVIDRNTTDDQSKSGVHVESDGKVNISGGVAAVSLKSGNGLVSGDVSGSEVHLTSTNSDSKVAAIQMTDSALNLNGQNINISAANGKAISVSGVNKSDNKGLTIGNGKDATNVTIDGRINVSDGGNVTFAKNTTTYVDSKYLKDTPFITTNNESGTVNADEGSQFVVKDYKNGDSLKFSDSEALNKNVSEKDQLKADNVLQKIELSTDGTFTVEKADQAVLDRELAGVVLKNVVTEVAGNASALKDLFLNEDGTVNAKVSNEAANLGELAGLNHGTYTASNLFTDTVGNHLSTLPQNKDLWGYYVHSKESVDGLGLAGAAAKYDTTYDGAVVGMDLYKSGNTAGGVAISYINGSLEGAGIKNDADYYGLSVYGRKDLSSFSLVGDVSYLHGSNDITQTLAGETVTAKPDVDAFTVGVKALKDIALTDTSKLTPYVGARYLRINTESFSSSLGLHYDADSQDLLLIPVGVDYSADFKHGAWTYRPTVGVGYVWNAAGRSVDETVSLDNAADSFSYNTVDSSSFIAHVGVAAEKENISFGVGYEYQNGSSTSTDKWYVNAAYRF